MTKKEIEKILTVNEVSKTKEGNFIARKGFYYKHGKTEEDLGKSIISDLMKAGIKYKIIDSGEEWRPFRGGASLRTQSHWWVKFNVIT